MTLCVILGAGGHAAETFWHAIQALDTAYERFVFVDDQTERESLTLGGRSWPVEKSWHFEPYRNSGEAIGFITGIGDPRGKVQLVEKALAAGLKPLPPIIHRTALVQDPECRIGEGTLVGPSCVITTGVSIGKHVLLNSGVVVSHGVTIEDFVSCAPRTAIGGDVTLRKGVSLGIGCVVREKMTVAPFVIAGAQACIIANIDEPGITVVGVPAKALRRDG